MNLDRPFTIEDGVLTHEGRLEIPAYDTHFCKLAPEEYPLGYWTSATELGEVLGYKSPRDSVTRLFENNRSAFNEDCTIVCFTPGSYKAERWFSLFGASVLCSLSKRPNSNALSKMFMKLSRANEPWCQLELGDAVKITMPEDGEEGAVLEKAGEGDEAVGVVVDEKPVIEGVDVVDGIEVDSLGDKPSHAQGTQKSVWEQDSSKFRKEEVFPIHRLRWMVEDCIGTFNSLGLTPGDSLIETIEYVRIATGFDIKPLVKFSQFLVDEDPLEYQDITDIAEFLGTTAVSVNRFLASIGWQKKDNLGHWNPTTLGMPFCRMAAYIGDHNHHRDWYLQWKPGPVIDEWNNQQ